MNSRILSLLFWYRKKKNVYIIILNAKDKNHIKYFIIQIMMGLFYCKKKLKETKTNQQNLNGILNKMVIK